LLWQIAYKFRQWQDSQRLETAKALTQRETSECIAKAQTIPEGSSRYTDAQKLLKQCEAGANWQNVQVKTLPAASDTIWSVAITPDAQTFASASQDKTIKIWTLPDRNRSVLLLGIHNTFYRLPLVLTAKLCQRR